MDSLVDITQGVDVVLNAGELRGIRQKSLHLGLRSAITELEVVEHRVVLAGKSHVCRLDHGHVCAHLVRVVAHVLQRLIGCSCCLGRVTVQRLQQGGREARHGLHVFVRRHARRLECVVRVLDDGVRRIAEEGLYASDRLLKVGRAHDRTLEHLPDTESRDHCDHFL